MKLKDSNLYYAGGVIRDEILGVKSLDVDYCYEGNAIEFAKSRNLNIIKTNPTFGTVRVLLDGKEIDIASTRREIYPRAGQLPEVISIGCSLKDDLKRRDFTVNALAKSTVTGEIIDFFNGIEDIKNKKLRILHSQSFIDDPTRIVRGLKFSVRFGFELEEETKRLQDNYLKNINYNMSRHRLKKELKETFNLNSTDAYEKFTGEGIYKLLGKNLKIPELKGSAQKLIDEFGAENPWLVYLGLFDLSSLDLTVEEIGIISDVREMNLAASDFELCKMFENSAVERVMLYALSTDYGSAYHYLKDLRKIKISLTGKDLKEMGIPEGRIYKEIFDRLLEEKLKNPKLRREDEICFVRENFV